VLLSDRLDAEGVKGTTAQHPRWEFFKAGDLQVHLMSPQSK
jgi:hypothetical protein